MRVASLILLLTAALSAGEWQMLFDGKTLEGWHVEAKEADRAKGFWRVVDGAILADSMGRKDHNYVWLIHDGEFADFELQLKVRGYTESTGNSGIQFRSRWDAAAEWLHGPQVDIHPPAPWRCGLIYDETYETRRWIYPSLPNWDIREEQGAPVWKWNKNDWNDVVIVARGGHITTSVNGVTITDKDLGDVLFDDAHRKHNVGRSGHIALQLHVRDELKIAYKDIRIRPLP